MVDWSTISNLATAGGTLVLAGASFASIRSADRAALSAERAVLASLRPLLIGSQLDSPTQKVVWHDAHWTHLDGGAGYVMLVDGNVYLAISLRNVGPGLGVIHGWRWVGSTSSYGPSTPIRRTSDGRPATSMWRPGTPASGTRRSATRRTPTSARCGS
ncbi:hypothetical protein E6W39_09540 [Kitasatospora acidiphila]|uniref:Uncharacterized protein n=1 Tax=Kitasatospora acidiphila TaxID=2567942 RepID=A0A540W0G7_9ACTN|nr:hypothetical protein [Kitasatospora acidiphila]TQF02471.1 hypothetical protein E6W39_09540 [Kitasatospora acidiphila]